MKKLLFLFISIVIVTGCDVKSTNELSSKVTSLDERVKILETQSKNQGNWILWKRTDWVDKSRFNNFGYPLMMSSFNTKEECMKSSEDWMIPNQRVTSIDPRIITDGTFEITYLCLPPTVDLRPIRR